MATILSWTFLVLSVISFVFILFISIKKSAKKIDGFLTGLLLGGLSAFICFVISAYIGMNFY